MAGIYSLGKHERLKSRKSIEALFASGKKITQSSYLLYYRFTEDTRSQPLLFGVGVSGRQFKRAVDRNRIKRLTREAYRVQKLPLKDKLLHQKKALDVFFIYTGKEIPQFADVQKTVGALIKKLEGILN